MKILVDLPDEYFPAIPWTHAHAEKVIGEALAQFTGTAWVPLRACEQHLLSRARVFAQDIR